MGFASQIAQLRRLVAPFHQFEAALNAGWSVQFTPCLEAPGLGGMGFHYSNPAFVEDGGAVNLLQPELLLYEPQNNGPMRFIGVEYIVLFSDHPATEPPPTLLGQAFEPVPTRGSGACTSTSGSTPERNLRHLESEGELRQRRHADIRRGSSPRTVSPSSSDGI